MFDFVRMIEDVEKEEMEGCGWIVFEVERKKDNKKIELKFEYDGGGSLYEMDVKVDDEWIDEEIVEMFSDEERDYLVLDLIIEEDESVKKYI
ncbi:MAG: hypothetical protein ACXACY_27710 [Candidatus Hodarchaeales archaeon]|jgi:hypothetical protein